MSTVYTNQTPSEVWHEGDEFKYYLRPEDEDGSRITLSGSSVALTIENGSTTDSYTLDDFSTEDESGDTAYYYTHILGPGTTKFVCKVTGTVQATDQFHIFAEPNP